MRWGKKLSEGRCRTTPTTPARSRRSRPAPARSNRTPPTVALPDGSALTITQVNGIPVDDGGPAVAVPNGSVQVVGGQLVFTPAPDYNGPVSFTYTASDGALASTATVSGTVTALPDAPRVGADTFTVAEDGSVAIDVRANDSDPDGGTLAITQVNGSAIVDGGAAVAVPGGSVRSATCSISRIASPDEKPAAGNPITVDAG